MKKMQSTLAATRDLTEDRQEETAWGESPAFASRAHFWAGNCR
jgi:hypothetical protein